MARSRKMEKAVEALRDGIEDFGLVADNYGHYKFTLAPIMKEGVEPPTTKPVLYRIKFQKIGYRVESKLIDRWVRIRSGKFTDGITPKMSEWLKRAVKA